MRYSKSQKNFNDHRLFQLLLLQINKIFLVRNQPIRFELFFLNSIFDIESLRKEDLILALSHPKIQSNEWKIFELSAHTGKFLSSNLNAYIFSLFLLIQVVV